MPACPNCKTKLRKEDIQKFVDVDVSKGEWVEERKYLMCKVCGHVLAERKP